MSKYRDYLLATIPIGVFFWITTWEGMLESPDSTFYLHIANHFYHFQEFRTPGGNPVLHWPPLYPLTLIPESIFEGYVKVFHFVLLILHQFLWLTIGKRFISNKGFYASFLGFNVLILMISIFVWSELLFCVLLAGCLLSILRYYDTGRRNWLVGIGIPLILALLTRNAGMFFIPGLLLFGWTGLRKELRNPFMLTIVLSCMGNLLWNYHRMVVLQNPHIAGELVPEFTFIRNFVLTFSEIAYNFIPRATPNWLAALATVFVLVISVLKKTNNPSTQNLVTLCLGSYLAVWIVIPAHIDNMGRFIAPIFPFIMILFIRTMESEFVRNIHKKLPIVLLTGFLLFFLLRTLSNVLTWTGVS